VNFASPPNLSIRFQRSRVNQPGPAFPQSPGIIFETTNSIFQSSLSQDSPVAIAPTHLLDSYLSLNWESSGPMCGEAHRTRVEVNSGRVRREHLRRREQNLYEPGSSPGKIPGGRHGARRARLLADRTRNRSQKFPVPVPNGSRPLHHPDRSFFAIRQGLQRLGVE